MRQLGDERPLVGGGGLDRVVVAGRVRAVGGEVDERLVEADEVGAAGDRVDRGAGRHAAVDDRRHPGERARLGGRGLGAVGDRQVDRRELRWAQQRGEAVGGPVDEQQGEDSRRQRGRDARRSAPGAGLEQRPGDRGRQRGRQDDDQRRGVELVAARQQVGETVRPQHGERGRALSDAALDMRPPAADRDEQRQPGDGEQRRVEAEQVLGVLGGGSGRPRRQPAVVGERERQRPVVALAQRGSDQRVVEVRRTYGDQEREVGEQAEPGRGSRVEGDRAGPVAGRRRAQRERGDDRRAGIEAEVEAPGGGQRGQQRREQGGPAAVAAGYDQDGQQREQQRRRERGGARRLGHRAGGDQPARRGQPGWGALAPREHVDRDSDRRIDEAAQYTPADQRGTEEIERPAEQVGVRRSVRPGEVGIRRLAAGDPRRGLQDQPLVELGAATAQRERRDRQGAGEQQPEESDP